jgi:hypothetical protein
MKAYAILLLTAALMSATSVRAFADPIVIIGGQVSAGSPSSGQDPPFGFELIGANTRVSGETNGFGGGGFNVGDTVTLSTTVTPAFVNHPLSQTIGGRPLDAFLDGAMEFAATPFTVKPTASLLFTTPFTMTGRIMGFATSSHSGQPLFDLHVTGAGTASVDTRDIGNGGFLVDFTSFTFSPAVAPTPEPGTLMLFGISLGAAALRMRRAYV